MLKGTKAPHLFSRTGLPQQHLIIAGRRRTYRAGSSSGNSVGSHLAEAAFILRLLPLPFRSFPPHDSFYHWKTHSLVELHKVETDRRSAIEMKPSCVCCLNSKERLSRNFRDVSIMTFLLYILCCAQATPSSQPLVCTVEVRGSQPLLPPHSVSSLFALNCTSHVKSCIDLLV